MGFDVKATIAKFTGSNLSAREIAIMYKNDALTDAMQEANAKWESNCYNNDGISNEEFRKGRDEIDQIFRTLLKTNV